MSTLSESRLIALLAPYLGDAAVPPTLYRQLSEYLDLLLKWNARTNLTAIRDAEAIVQRHFGESLFCGLQLRGRLGARDEVLDFGSGAGFPGLPIQLLLPELRVTLGESQGKKASFLREAVRTLNLPGTEVWASRIEEMPEARRFTAVTLRAVDRMDVALAAAVPRVVPGGWLVTLAEGSMESATENVAMPKPGVGWVTLQECL